MKYAAVIFDLDGTLLNTLDDLTDSINFTMNKYCFPRKTLEQVRSYVGNGISRLLEMCIPNGMENELFDSAFQVFIEHYARNCFNKTKPYNGILEVLSMLKSKGIKMAVVSNKTDPEVKALSKIFFKEYITVSLGEISGISKKPAPDLALMALERLHSTKGETLYIGDSEVDIQTAKNSGLKCISVSWGFRNAQMLREYGATIIVDSPEEILDFFGSKGF